MTPLGLKNAGLGSRGSGKPSGPRAEEGGPPRAEGLPARAPRGVVMGISQATGSAPRWRRKRTGKEQVGRLTGCHRGGPPSCAPRRADGGPRNRASPRPRRRLRPRPPRPPALSPPRSARAAAAAPTGDVHNGVLVPGPSTPCEGAGRSPRCADPEGGRKGGRPCRGTRAGAGTRRILCARAVTPAPPQALTASILPPPPGGGAGPRGHPARCPLGSCLKEEIPQSPV